MVGYERQVTAEAGYRVGLSAGAKVVHVASGRLDASEVKAVGRSLPDLVLLVGGTDGGDSEVLLHNATQLARAALGRPVVVAGNVDARDEVVALLRDAGQPVRVADNVVPEIGEISPGSARAAIRATFLDHVIGGQGAVQQPLVPRDGARADAGRRCFAAPRWPPTCSAATCSSSTSGAPRRTSTRS